MGRKKKNNRMIKYVMVRFTESDYEKVREGMKVTGYKTNASYVRTCVLRRTEHNDVRVMRFDTDKMELYLKEIKRIGVNLNQAIKKLNSFDSSGEGRLTDETRKLKEKADEVTEMTKKFQKMIEEKLLPLCDDRREREGATGTVYGMEEEKGKEKER